MIYEIRMSYELYSMHLSLDEAESYAADLRKVYPMDDISVIPHTPGRLPGQEQIIWGGECVLQLPSVETHQWAKIYLWQSQVAAPLAQRIPKVGDIVPDLLSLVFATTTENEAKREIRSAFAGVQWEVVGDGIVRRVK